MPKRIPVKAAREIAKTLGLKQVILAAWDGDLTHVVTYGETAEDCDQAAMGGDAFKKALGWPESANSKPSRLKAAEKRADDAESMVSQAYQVIGNLLSECDSFESDAGQRALDYFSGGEYDENFLPWNFPRWPRTREVFESVVEPESDDGLLLQSWSDDKSHARFKEFVGKRVRVTVEVIGDK